MRSHKERVAEAKRRIAGQERKKRMRRRAAAAAAAAAACLALIVGCALAMPDMAGRIRPGGEAGFEMAASMFGGSAALGYIVIGLLAFLLGVCVTILCFRLRQLEREDAREAESEGRHGAD